MTITEVSEMSMSEFADKFIENVHAMSSRIPGFGALYHEDQMRLLESAWVELFLIGLVEATHVVIPELTGEATVCHGANLSEMSEAPDDVAADETEIDVDNDVAKVSQADDKSTVYLKGLHVEIDRIRSLGLKPRELDNLRGLILFNPGN